MPVSPETITHSEGLYHSMLGKFIENKHCADCPRYHGIKVEHYKSAMKNSFTDRTLNAKIMLFNKCYKRGRVFLKCFHVDGAASCTMVIS